MRLELINTGSELLLGFTVNTHANYIAGKLAERGLRLIRQTTVGDDREEMRAAVAAALSRSDIILITGGLGPTSDDFTRDVVAELLGRKLVHNAAVAAAITEQFREIKNETPERLAKTRPAFKREFVTAEDLEPAVKSGKKEYILPRNAIVTSLAHDYASQHGLVLRED